MQQVDTRCSVMNDGLHDDGTFDLCVV